MGSYFGADFLAYSHRRTFGPREYVANVGRASAEMLSTLFLLVFARVIPLDRFPPENGTSPGPAVDGVIEPRIEDFAFRLGFDSDGEQCNVTYRMTVLTPEGVPVTTWTVRGKAILDRTPIPTWDHVNADLADAAKVFLKNFDSSFAPAAAALAAAKRPLPDLDFPGEKDILLKVETFSDPALAANEYGFPVSSAGMVAVRISVTNKGSRKVLIRESDAWLIMPGGKRVASASPTMVVSKLEQASKTGVVVAGLMGSTVGTFATLAEEADKNEKRQLLRKEIQGKRLGEQWLIPGGSAHGFLLFIPPEDMPAFNRGDLDLWFVDPETGRGVRIRSALENICFAGNVSK
jgi:hypothetical protein